MTDPITTSPQAIGPITIASIVEGDGEVSALPVLLRRRCLLVAVAFAANADGDVSSRRI